MTTGDVGSAYQSTVTKTQYSVTATVPFSDDGSPLPNAKEFEQKLIALFSEYCSKFEDDEKLAQQNGQ